MISNLSKTFKYVNAHGDVVIFNYDNNYLINKPEGIDTLTVNIAQAQGINQVGAVIDSINVQPRPVTISGKIVGEAQGNSKDYLLSVVRPDLNGKLYADDYYLDVHPTATPVIEAAPRFARFQLSLLAPYPYWKKDDTISTELSGVVPMFRLPCNFTKPYRFGKLVETQFFNVTNRGQVPTPFKVTITANGTVVNPSILNVTTGKILKLNKTLNSGETVVIDITHDRTHVISSADGDIRGALSLKSDFYRLEVGDNVLKPDADSGKSEMQISVNFATEIVGVSV